MRCCVFYWQVVVVVALLLAAGGLAMASAAPSLQVHPEFSGTVYLPDGKPAANATLVGWGVLNWYREVSGGGPSAMTGGPLEKIITDAQGRYRTRLDLAPPDRVPPEWALSLSYNVLFISPHSLGYTILHELGREGREGRRSTPLDLHLQPGDRVQGRVLGYPGGQPVSGAEVVAKVYPDLAIGHFWPEVEQAVTDAEGRFRLGMSLPPTAYKLHVVSAGWATAETKFDPPLSGASAARTVEIRLARPYTIRGRAYGPDDRPLRKVRIMGPSFGSVDGTMTDDTGAYALPQEGRGLDFSPGQYLPRYVLLAPRLESGEVAPPVFVDATDPATQAVDLHFTAPATITCRVVDARSGKPVPPAWGRLVLEWPGTPPSQWDQLGDALIDKPRSINGDDLDGKLVLRGVAPGHYQLQIMSHLIQALTAENGKAISVTVKPGETLDLGTVQVPYALQSIR